MKHTLFTRFTALLLTIHYFSSCMNISDTQADIIRNNIFSKQGRRTQDADTVNNSLKKARRYTCCLTIVGFIGWKAYVTDISSALKFCLGIAPAALFTLYKHRKASLLKESYNHGQAITG